MSTRNEQSYELYIDGALKAKGNAYNLNLSGLINEAFAYAKEIRLVPVRPAQHRIVERYVGTVHLVLPGDINSQAEAVDAVSAMLTDNLESHGVIDGWGYAKIGGQWLYPSRQNVRNSEQAEDSGDILDY